MSIMGLARANLCYLERQGVRFWMEGDRLYTDPILSEPLQEILAPCLDEIRRFVADREHQERLHPHVLCNHASIALKFLLHMESHGTRFWLEGDKLCLVSDTSLEFLKEDIEEYADDIRRILKARESVEKNLHLGSPQEAAYHLALLAGTYVMPLHVSTGQQTTN